MSLRLLHGDPRLKTPEHEEHSIRASQGVRKVHIRLWPPQINVRVHRLKTLGRHTNDKMISFYVRAPGDWDIEFGTDGMRVDESYYTAEEITADSYWGHQWVGEMPAAMRL